MHVYCRVKSNLMKDIGHLVSVTFFLRHSVELSSQGARTRFVLEKKGLRYVVITFCIHWWRSTTVSYAVCCYKDKDDNVQTLVAVV